MQAARIPVPVPAAAAGDQEVVASPRAAPAVQVEGETEAELVGWVKGRRLEIDWFAVACCGAMAGDLRLRWRRPAEPLDPELNVVDGPEGLEIYLHPDLAAVLSRARSTLAMRGIGPFRHPVILLRDGRAWLDFVAGCRRRR